MVAMAVGDHDQLDLRGVEPKLPQAGINDPLGLIVIVHRVDQDDAVRGRDGPGADPFAAHEVEIVEGLAWRRQGHQFGWGRQAQAGRRRCYLPELQLGTEILARRLPCRREVPLNGFGLCRRWANGQRSSQAAGAAQGQ